MKSCDSFHSSTEEKLESERVQDIELPKGDYSQIAYRM